MAKHQLPPLKDEKTFEEFICDLFNQLENTNSYQNTDFQSFGIKGQNQKGIDIFSSKTRTVIQCKLKDIRKKDDTIRKSLIEDIEQDLSKVAALNFSFDRFVLASTFRDDSQLQEYVTELKERNQYPFNLYYWGWDTLSKHAEENEEIIKKYFPKFIPKKPKQPKPELPDGALGKDLLKKNYITYLIKRYGDWKQIELTHKGENFNWASFNKHIMNQYRAPGINYIHINHFNDMVVYLQDKIDKTVFGRNNKAKGKRNYSSFEEHTQGILD
ncbi:MAG: endonuclease [Bacteroidota bacterium]|nr:endonuclease [Bacteroidota bacterium]